MYNHTWLVKYHKCNGGKFPNRQKKRNIKRWTCHFQRQHQHNFSSYPFSNTVVFDETITKSIRNCVTFGVKHEPRKWPIWHLQPPSAFHDTSRHNSYKIPIYTLLKWTINSLTVFLDAQNFLFLFFSGGKKIGTRSPARTRTLELDVQLEVLGFPI